jgi:hypothetical protein
VIPTNADQDWNCEQFIPFTNDPETNLWLLPLFPLTTKDNGIYPMPSYSAAVACLNHLLQVKRRRDPKFHEMISTATSVVVFKAFSFSR